MTAQVWVCPLCVHPWGRPFVTLVMLVSGGWGLSWLMALVQYMRAADSTTVPLDRGVWLYGSGAGRSGLGGAGRGEVYAWWCMVCFGVGPVYLSERCVCLNLSCRCIPIPSVCLAASSGTCKTHICGMLYTAYVWNHVAMTSLLATFLHNFLS